MVFHLSQPTGDFLYRLAMPATAPAPREVADCFEEAQEYGRYLVASGPYQLEGAGDLDATSCDTLEPISGYDPTRFMYFERNPSYDAATDSPEVRQALPDRFTIDINSNVDDIFNKIEAGELEGSPNSPPSQVIARYTTDPELEDRLRVNAGDRTWYLTMNLTMPPFDDVNVRKAANLVLDKAGMLQAWGGETAGEIATHIMPPEMTGGTPTNEEYDPYPSDGWSGDEEAAKEAMSASKYDTNGDGMCDESPECQDVLHIAGDSPPFSELVPVIESSFAKIGITFTTRELEDAYTPISTVSTNLPMGSRPGWGKDYADASTFMVLFDGRNINPTGNYNYSLVGLTPEKVAEMTDLAAEADTEFNFEGVTETTTSVDADIDACLAIPEVDERNQCWIDLDKKLMEDIVPWAPYLWAHNVDAIGPAVSQFEYDQFSGEAALAHVAVDEGLQN